MARVACFCDRQWRLALGMLAADRTSGLTPAERSKACAALSSPCPVPVVWYEKIAQYLRARHANSVVRR